MVPVLSISSRDRSRTAVSSKSSASGLAAARESRARRIGPARGSRRARRRSPRTRAAGCAGPVAAQALVAADDVAPLHQPQPRLGVDLERSSRRPGSCPSASRQVRTSTLAATSCALAGGVGQLPAGPPGWLPTSSGRLGDQAEPGGAGVDQPGRRCGRRRRSSAPRRRPRSGRRAGAGAGGRPRSVVASSRRSSIEAEQRDDHGGDPRQVGQRPDPGQVEQPQQRAGRRAGRCRRGPGAACARRRGRRRRGPASASP